MSTLQGSDPLIDDAKFVLAHLVDYQFSAEVATQLRAIEKEASTRAADVGPGTYNPWQALQGIAQRLKTTVGSIREEAFDQIPENRLTEETEALQPAIDDAQRA